MERSITKLQSRASVALLAVLAAGTWVVALQGFAGEAKADAMSRPQRQAFGEITVERINVVDRDGKPRLVIANQDRFPDPVVRGEPVPRSIHNTAGIVFYDGEGNEAGGLATSVAANGMKQGALILDYGVQPTDGVGIVKGETADGKSYFAGLTVADRLPYKPGKIETSEGISRIWVGNQSRDATIELADTRGNARIRISVDKHDVPHFEVLDADGKVVRRLLDEAGVSRGG